MTNCDACPNRKCFLNTNEGLPSGGLISDAKAEQMALEAKARALWPQSEGRLNDKELNTLLERVRTFIVYNGQPFPKVKWIELISNHIKAITANEYKAIISTRNKTDELGRKDDELERLRKGIREIFHQVDDGDEPRKASHSHWTPDDFFMFLFELTKGLLKKKE